MSTTTDPDVIEGWLEKWARMQCEDAEIEGALVVQGGMTIEAAHELVVTHTEMLQRQRWNGRVEMREHIFRVSTGDKSCTQNGAQMSILAMFARAHLGYAKEGPDDQVRKAIAEAERKKARRGSKPELVPPPSAVKKVP